MPFVKAHAYDNDFVLVAEDELQDRDGSVLARALCHRHRGPGGDGLIVHQSTPTGARMRLFNADGSRAELSGNGVRCVAAYLVWRGWQGDELIVETDAGPARLTLLERDGGRLVFRATMGQPEEVRRLDLAVGDETVAVVALRVGNPQCVVLDASLDEEALYRLGPLLSRHPAFPEGTNVELLRVESPKRLHILIWERGVGPTQASGTGACAAAVAGALYCGAERTVEVVAPGGTQRVEWRDDGLYLTGWAEVVLEGQWWG